MRTQKDAQFADWDQAQAAIDGAANENPGQVMPDLTSRGQQIAEAFEAVEKSQWDRTGPVAMGLLSPR